MPLGVAAVGCQVIELQRRSLSLREGAVDVLTRGTCQIGPYGENLMAHMLIVAFRVGRTVLLAGIIAAALLYLFPGVFHPPLLY